MEHVLQQTISSLFGMAEIKRIQAQAYISMT